ncbi:MAG TPA: hypothetical protein VNN19_06510 [bacterium]|nr:hypothetical protein [bacterium]
MSPIDPRQLIGPASPLGSPAPFWLLEVFKVLGFTLHQVPMHLWYAGLPLAALLGLLPGEPARRLRARLLGGMPLIVAAGINLGIVPLLFTQVAYYRVFYPAGVLIAWPWFSVIVLLTVAYYAVYIAALGERGGRRPRLARAAVWVAALLFPAIGFIFANLFSLMTRLEAWPALAARTDAAGAVTGLALHTGDPTLLPRWLMLFGLALLTTAGFIVADAAILSPPQGAGRAFTARVAGTAATAGLAIFLVAGWRYAQTAPVDIPLFWRAPAAGLPAITWLLIVLQRGEIARPLAVAAALVQFAALGANAAARQWLQNRELARYLDLAAEPVRLEWSPLLLFLVLFVLGLVVVAWIASQMMAAVRMAADQPARAGGSASPAGRRTTS